MPTRWRAHVCAAATRCSSMSLVWWGGRIERFLRSAACSAQSRGGVSGSGSLPRLGGTDLACISRDSRRRSDAVSESLECDVRKAAPLLMMAPPALSAASRVGSTPDDAPTDSLPCALEGADSSAQGGGALLSGGSRYRISWRIAAAECALWAAVRWRYVRRLEFVTPDYDQTALQAT